MTRFVITLSVALLLLPLSSPAAADPVQNEASTLAVIRGRIICLDAAGRVIESPFGCNESNHHFGLAGRDGKLYNFSPTDAMAAMFTDIRVQQRELQVSGRLSSGNHLEVIKVQSIKEGRLYDIFYFCEVCNIKAFAPGLCPCCRNDLEFREALP